MKKGLVFDIRRYSVHDGPGIRTTIFFKGCPLACKWCHNPEGILPGIEAMKRKHVVGRTEYPYEQQVGRWMTAGEVFGQIIKDRIFYEESGGGVTFSGGEPLMQPEFLLELAGLCKREGLHTATDTSGHAPAGAAMTMLDTDLVLYDIKCSDPDRHREWTGEDNRLILENLKLVAGGKPRLIIRIPLVPGFNSDIEELQAILAMLKPFRMRIFRVDILPYHKLGSHKYRDLGRSNYGRPGEVPAGTEVELALSLFSREGYKVKKGG